jgi:hypothetical protein
MRWMLTLLLLGGCVSPQQQMAWDIERVAPRCEAIGYRKGTTEWRGCVERALTQKEASRPRAVNCQRFLNGDVICQ